MDRPDARAAARDILKIIPLVMRTVAAELRAAGEMPAPAHFGLLTVLGSQSRTLTELAQLQGVSLPTMSNSVSTLVERGWVTRSSQVVDRRVALIEVTPLGRATLDRVGKAAESHLADRLANLDGTARRRLHLGLGVLHRVFAEAPAAPSARPARATRSNSALKRSV